MSNKVWSYGSNTVYCEYTLTGSTVNGRATVTADGKITGNSSSSDSSNDLYIHLCYDVSPENTSSSSTYVSDYGSKVSNDYITSISWGGTALTAGQNKIATHPLNKTTIGTSGKTFTCVWTFPIGVSFEEDACTIFFSASSSDPSATNSNSAYKFIGKKNGSISNYIRYITESISAPAGNVHYIHYYKQDGTASSIADTTFIYNSDVGASGNLASTTPTQSGYTFGGWKCYANTAEDIPTNLAAAGADVSTLPSIGDADYNVYERFSLSYKVTYANEEHVLTGWNGTQRMVYGSNYLEFDPTQSAQIYKTLNCADKVMEYNLIFRPSTASYGAVKTLNCANKLMSSNLVVEKDVTYTAIAQQPETEMTSDTGLYWSTRWTSTYPAYKAFTRTVHTQGYASSGTTGGYVWIGKDLGAANAACRVKVSFANRNNSNVNGPNTLEIWGSNTEIATESGDITGTATLIASFSGMDGSVAGSTITDYILDSYGNETSSGLTRTQGDVETCFRYIFLRSTDWYGGTYMAVGSILIDGYTKS